MITVQQQQNQKIINRYKTKPKNNWLFDVLKYSLVGSIFVGLLLILIFYNTTILGRAERADYFLSFNSLQIARQYNFLIISKVSLLFFVLFYSIIKNYINLVFHKELIKIYIPWYILYYLFSIAAFVLFFVFNPYANLDKYVPDNNVYQHFWLTFILIPLTILNIANYFYFYFTKKNKNKIGNNKLSSIIVSTIAQILFVAGYISIFWLLIEKQQNDLPALILDKSQIYLFMEQLFSVKTSLNIIYMIAIILTITILLIGMNFPKIQFLLKREYNHLYFKSQIILFLSSAVALIIWFVFILITTQKNTDVISASKQNSYIALIVQIIFILIFTSLYFASNFVSFLKPKGKINPSFYFVVVQLLIWISVMIATRFSTELLINSIILIISVVISTIISLFYLIYIKNTSFYMILLTFVFLGAISLLLFVSSLNTILIERQNYALSSFNIDFTMNEILIIFIITILSTFLISLLIDSGITLVKILKHNKSPKKKGSK
ncbi:MSC_0624 family F1-like ATPase-associated membrane protein [Mycoplasma sp. 1012]